jgi:hypothetical protein
MSRELIDTFEKNSAKGSLVVECILDVRGTKVFAVSSLKCRHLKCSNRNDESFECNTLESKQIVGFRSRNSNALIKFKSSWMMLRSGLRSRVVNKMSQYFATRCLHKIMECIGHFKS